MGGFWRLEIFKEQILTHHAGLDWVFGLDVGLVVGHLSKAVGSEADIDNTVSDSCRHLVGVGRTINLVVGYRAAEERRFTGR